MFDSTGGVSCAPGTYNPENFARIFFKALLVPRLAGDAKTRIEPISRRDAMAKQLPCYSLSLARELAEIAGTIAEFLDKAA